jgi:hypothetical protein
VTTTTYGVVKVNFVLIQRKFPALVPHKSSFVAILMTMMMIMMIMIMVIMVMMMMMIMVMMMVMSEQGIIHVNTYVCGSFDGRDKVKL